MPLLIKTAAGRAEIRQRSLPLSRAGRNLLLIVDDSRDSTAWVEAIKGCTAGDLQMLIEAGLVAPVPGGQGVPNLSAGVPSGGVSVAPVASVASAASAASAGSLAALSSGLPPMSPPVPSVVPPQPPGSTAPRPAMPPAARPVTAFEAVPSVPVNTPARPSPAAEPARLAGAGDWMLASSLPPDSHLHDETALERVSRDVLYTRLTAEARPALGLMAGYRMVLALERAPDVQAVRRVAVDLLAQVRAARGEAAAQALVGRLTRGC